MKMVERLREYSKYAMKGAPGISDTVLVSAQFLTEVAAALEAADFKLAKAAEALEPFANFDTEDFPDAMRAFEDDPDLTIGHFRRARTALSQIRSEK